MRAHHPAPTANVLLHWLLLPKIHFSLSPSGTSCLSLPSSWVWPNGTASSCSTVLQAGARARQEALLRALDDLVNWLNSGEQHMVRYSIFCGSSGLRGHATTRPLQSWPASYWAQKPCAHFLVVQMKGRWPFWTGPTAPMSAGISWYVFICAKSV